MTQKFGSLSNFPGKTGKFYYSKFFEYYNIDAEYNPHRAENTQEFLTYLSDESYSGFNISMPFKQQVIKYLHVSSQDVLRYNSCNTIKIVDGKFQGFNTDKNGVLKMMSYILTTDYVIVLGNGVLGKTFANILNSNRIQFEVFSRSLNNWEMRHKSCDVLINCTALGTSIDSSPVEVLNVTRTVIDLAIKESKLKLMSKSHHYVSGRMFYREVFFEQFAIHTSIYPDPDYFDYLTTLLD